MEDIYVRIWFSYNPSIELSKCGRNIQYPMLAFHNEKTASRKKYLQAICPLFMLAYFKIVNSYVNL